MRCVLPTVTITGYSTDVPYLALLPNARETIEAVINIGLSLGVKLHFQNFAATSLGFSPGLLGPMLQLSGQSTLMPDGTSVCSPVPPPEPPSAPTRALSRTTATWGRGEYLGTRGDVLPFDLIPEEDVELDTSGGLPGQFMVVKNAELKGTNTIGVEAPPLKSLFTGTDQEKKVEFVPYSMSTRLRVVERVGKCWVKPVPTPQFLELVEGSNHIVRALFVGQEMLANKEMLDGKQMVSGELPGALKDGHLQFADIRAADFEKEIYPLMKEGGLSCAEGCGDAWSRIQVFGIPKGPFEDGDPRLAPIEIIVWLDRDAREIREIFRPSLECGYAELYQEIRKDVPPRRYSDPRVTLNPYKIDSIDLPSINLTALDTRGKHRRAIVWTPDGAAVEITLTDQCQALDSCWTESVMLPPSGEVSVTQGFSDTTVPRGAIRSSTPAAFGSRTVAAQGLFDRSGVAVFTDVPRVYRDIGLTTKYSDYRGTRYFDWNHTATGAFAAPGGATAHVRLGKDAWNAVRRPFFANWKTDIVTLSHRATYPMSYCTLLENMNGVPMELKFTHGGLASPILVSPSQVFTSPPGPNGDYRLAPGVSGRASAASFVGP